MSSEIISQHLIDPELCIRCNTCEETCPVGAISNDGRNYVVDPALCDGCRNCVDPCPTGAVNVWLPVTSGQVYSRDEQFSWDSLPQPDVRAADLLPAESQGGRGQAGAVQENLFSLRHPALATLGANVRLTTPDSGVDIHHIVLDLSAQYFPFLEGQSVGILPPGLDDQGKPHPMRLYSVASASQGEGGQAGQLALTVKRVVEDHQGQARRGICSNYLCDLAPGSEVRVVGPFGVDFLLPAAAAPMVMICTGTGIAPMRAMLQRLQASGQADVGRLLLFYGGRNLEALAYREELQELRGRYALDLELALSRQPGQPRRYVQDVLEERHEVLARLLVEGRVHLYLCGLKGIEQGVFEALRRICAKHGLHWNMLRQAMLEQCRLHVETY